MMIVTKVDKDNSYFLRELIAILIPIIAVTSSIGLIDLNYTNLMLAILILFIYLLQSVIDDRVNLFLIFISLITMIPIVFSQAFNMVSLTLILLLYDMFKDYKDVNRCLKYFFLVSTTLFLVVTLLYFFFGLNSVYDMDMWRINKIVHRSSLGFNHPNTAMLTFIGIVFSYLGLLKARNFRLNIFYIGVVTYICFYFTQSRTSTYGLVIALIFLFIIGEKAFSVLSNFFKFIILITPTGLFLISLLVLFSPPNQMLNTLFSGRQALYQQFYKQIGGLKWLASSSLENAMFDNGYLQALLSKGMLFSMLALILFIWIICMYIHKIDYIQFIVLFVFFAIAFTETTLFKFEILFPVLLVLNRVYESPNELDYSLTINH